MPGVAASAASTVTGLYSFSMSRISTAGHEAVASRVSNAMRSCATAAASLRPVELEDVGDVLLVGGADLGEPLLFGEVVVTLRQAESRLEQPQRVDLWILGVGKDLRADRVVDHQQLRARQVVEQLLAVLDRRDAVELGLQRREAQLLGPRLVHEAGVEVADQLLVGARRGLGARRFLDDHVQVLLGGVRQDRERAVVRLVGRDLACS